MNMKRWFSFVTPGLLLLLALLACNLPGSNYISPDNPSDLENIGSNPAEEISNQPGEAAESQSTSLDGKITLTPRVTLTATPEVALVWVTQNTNCRAGPNKIYDNLGALLLDEKTEILGIGSTGSYYIVKNPDIPGGECWLWDNYAQTSGDLSELPEMTPPPSPTPAEILSFQASIGDNHDCGLNFTVNYWIGNNGNLDLESASVKLVDLDTSITLVGPAQSNAPFVTSPTSCPPGISALSPTGSAYIPIRTLITNPSSLTSHTLRATIKLCAHDGLGEPCLTKTVDYVVPGASDVAVKTNITSIEPQEILEKVLLLDVFTWNYKTDNSSVRHIGPMAQDFYQSFEVGDNDTHIFAIDADGVALASIQALHEQLQILESRLDEMSQEPSPQPFYVPLWSVPIVLLIGIFVGYVLERRRSRS